MPTKVKVRVEGRQSESDPAIIERARKAGKTIVSCLKCGKPHVRTATNWFIHPGCVRSSVSGVRAAVVLGVNSEMAVTQQKGNTGAASVI